MANNSKIEWTDSTWNPIAGCSIVSPGCKNCYAMRIANRFSTIKGHKYEGTAKSVDGHPVWTGKINLVEKDLEIPLHWREPRRIFVNSMSDLFHEGVPFDFIDKVFAVMALCPQHTFQILTKRPERMAEYLLSRTAIDDSGRYEYSPQWYQVITGWLDESYGGGRIFNSQNGWDLAHAAVEKLQFSRPLPNVWLGTSVERQKEADERVPNLLKCPAAVRFVSQEPQLGPVVYRDEWLTPTFSADDPRFYQPGGRGLDWIIVGGESGPGARAFDLDWARTTITQCGDFGVACFVKQLGAKVCHMAGFHQLILKDRKGGDWNEWPEDLRVREFPQIQQEAMA